MIGLKKNLFATALSNMTIDQNSLHVPSTFSNHICLLPMAHKPCENVQENKLPELLLDDVDFAEDLIKAKPAIVKKSSYTSKISK